MANQITIVESAAKFLAAFRIAVPKWIGASSVFLRLAAIARLYTCPRARRTFAGMAVILTLMLVAEQGFIAFLAASPEFIRTSPHGGLAVAAVAAISDGLRTGWTGAGVAKHDAFMLTTFQGPPALLSAGMRGHPRVKNWIDFLGAVAGVPVWDLSLRVLPPTFRAAPGIGG